MYAFDYVRPKSVDEVASLLTEDDDAKILAGGMSFLPTMKLRLAQPSKVIDLNALKDLREIKEEANGITIGAMATHGAVAYSPLVKRVIPGLAHMVEDIGDAQVKNRGTIGGSIANNDPAADYPAAVVALGATIRTNRREIDGEAFFTGMFETALEQGEIITAVHFPKPESCAYAKFRNPASRFALVGVFIAKRSDGIRVTVAGAGPVVFRVPAIEEALTKDFRAAAIDAVEVSADGLNSDIHAAADYRAHLIKVMAKRALEGLR